MALGFLPERAAIRKSAAAARTGLRPGRMPYYLRHYPVIPAALLLLLLFIGAVGSTIAPYERDIGDLRDRHLRPLSTGFIPEDAERPEHQVRAWWPAGFYLFGTDHAGRDIFSRLLHGAQKSIIIMALSLSSGILIGTTLGIAAGWFRGVLDELITRLVDIWMALPFVMLATVVTLVFGRSITILILILVLITWTGFIRLVRAETIRVKERDYIDSARVSGASRYWIIRRHILPHVMPTLLVVFSSAAAGLITADAIINFLGIGFNRVIPTWGNMINNARDYMVIAPHQFAVPSVALLVVTFAFIFLGDWLRDRLNPNLRTIQ